MSTRKNSTLRLPNSIAVTLLAYLAVIFWSTALFAQGGVPTIVRVEEDWTLNVSAPE